MLFWPLVIGFEYFLFFLFNAVGLQGESVGRAVAVNSLFWEKTIGANEVRAHARLRARADVVATILGILLLFLFSFSF